MADDLRHDNVILTVNNAVLEVAISQVLQDRF